MRNIVKHAAACGKGTGRNGRKIFSNLLVKRKALTALRLFAIFAVFVMMLAGLQPTVDYLLKSGDTPPETIAALNPVGVFDAGNITDVSLDALIGECNDTTDTDGDLIPDSVERVLGTDWNSSDSDRDQLNDNYEIRTGLNPLKTDSNGDGLSDYMETLGSPAALYTGWENGSEPDAYVTGSNDAFATWGLTSSAAHSGKVSFFLNGSTNGDMNGDSKQFLFLNILNVSIPVKESTRLTFYIYHENGSAPNVALDGYFSDGTSIMESGIKDQYGVPAAPNIRTDPCGMWYLVEYDLSPEKGKNLTSIGLSYSHDGPMINEQFSVYLDDIRVWNADFDGDGVVNAMDSDNDNDGIADSLDLSKFASAAPSDSFDFSVGLGPEPTYMDFQVVPENTDHLKYTGASWDWPFDEKGQMQDLDNSKDDITLQPMLEMEMDRVPSQDSVNEYGMAIKRSFTPQKWSDFIDSPSKLGRYTTGGGAAIADIDGNGKLDIVLMGIDNPEKNNRFWYMVGWNLNADGKTTDWSDVVESPEIGYDNDGGGMALADIDGNGKLDIVLMGIDNPEKNNRFWYMVGWNLDSEGKPADWSSVVKSPEIGYYNDGGGMALADIDGNGKLDIVLMGIDNPEKNNRFWYMVGWNLDSEGKPADWSDIKKSPKIGYSDEGGGLILRDIDGNGKLDMLFTAIDNPAGPNSLQYMVGWDLDAGGNVDDWGPMQKVEMPVDTTNGGGAAIADIDGNGELDLLMMDVRPVEQHRNAFSYTIGWNLRQKVYVPLWPVKDKEDTVALQGRAFLPPEENGDMNISAYLTWMAVGQTDSYNLQFLQKGQSPDGDGWSRIKTPIYTGHGEIDMWVREPLKGQVDIITGGSDVQPPDGWVKIDSPLGFSTYMIVKKGLEEHIDVKWEDEAQPSDKDWNIVSEYLINEGTIWSEIKEKVFIYIRKDESAFVNSKPATLAVYRDRAGLSGLTITQNMGTSAGLFYSNDMNSTIKSHAVLNYGLLRNNTNISEAPSVLAEYGLTQKAWMANFSHRDAAAKATAEAVRDAARNMTSGSLMPVSILTDSRSRMIGLENIPVGRNGHTDMKTLETVRSRSVQMLWVDTGTGDPASMSELVDEVGNWKWLDQEDKVNTSVIMLVWMAGDFEVSIGSEVIDHSVTEEKPILSLIRNDTNSTGPDYSDFKKLVLAAVKFAAHQWISGMRLYKVRVTVTDRITEEQRAAVWARDDERFDTLVKELREAQAAEDIGELGPMLEARGLNLAETSSISWVDSTMEFVAKVAIALAIILAIYTFWSIASQEGWSGYGITLGLIVAGLGLIYFAILAAIAMIPVVGWIIDILILIVDFIATFFFHKGSGWIIHKIVEKLVSMKLRTKVDMDESGSQFYVEDYGDNGLTAGDKIVIKSLFVEHVKATDRGSNSDVEDSYIRPHFHADTSSCGGKTEEKIIDNVLYRDSYSDHRDVYREIGVWVKPGEAKINFAITSHIHTKYKIYYDKCVCGICSEYSKTGHEDSPDQTAYLDILPDSIDGFLGWRAITPTDRDFDGLSDEVEDSDNIYYSLVQNSTGNVLTEDAKTNTVRIEKWSASDLQKWAVDWNGSYMHLHSKESGEALSSDGGHVITEAPNTAERQDWSLMTSGDYHYYLVHRSTGKWLDGSGAEANLREPARSDSQKWSFSLEESNSRDTTRDSDGDGLSDAFEAKNFFRYGTNPLEADSDHDGLTDSQEIRMGTSPSNNDTDGDGLTDFEEYRGWKIYFGYGNATFMEHVYPNPLLVDSDGDGLTDLEERDFGLNPSSVDTNGDGINDTNTAAPLLFTALGNDDTDGDGLTNMYEWAGTTINVTASNGTYALSTSSDILLGDTDGDGVSDAQEYARGLNPHSIDTDGDGLNDSMEIALSTDPTNWDTDGDGLGDAEEIEMGSSPFINDTDADGLNDAMELSMGSDPASNDTDGDGLNDAQELTIGTGLTSTDTDGDGLSDTEEIAYGAQPLVPDTDGDGVSDWIEVYLGSNVNGNDTDGDGLNDGYERNMGLNITNADTDGDGLNDSYEITVGTSPFLADTDMDLINDSVDHDTPLGFPDNVVLVTDGSEYTDEMFVQMSQYTNVTVMNSTAFLAGHADAENVILTGNPNSTDNSTWGLMVPVLADYGRNISSVAEGHFDGLNIAYGVWTENQTVIMLSNASRMDPWQVLGILKSRSVSAKEGRISATYHSPQQFISLEAEHETNAHIGVAFEDEITPRVVVTNESEGKLGTPAGDKSLNQYVDYRIYEGGSEVTGGISYAWVIMYYNLSERDNVNESNICMYYYDESADEWLRLSEDLDWVNEIRLNTTDIFVDGGNYSGFIAVNVSRTGTFALAESNAGAGPASPDPMLVIGLAIAMILMLLALMYAVRPHIEERREEEKEDEPEREKEGGKGEDEG